jgi:hypothetical protein
VTDNPPIRKELIAPVTFIEHEHLRLRVSILKETLFGLLRVLAAESAGAPETIRLAAEELIVATNLPALEAEMDEALRQGAADETARKIRDRNFRAGRRPDLSGAEGLAGPRRSRPSARGSCGAVYAGTTWSM